ncbi:MAG TPA: RDD family protein [Trebonia sp.]|nr:RDD family protein [Trebonia sp.]
MTADTGGLTGLRGHYAGFVSRFLTYVIDLAVIGVLFGLALAAVSFAASLIKGHAFSWSGSGIAVAIAYGCWWFVYFAYSWAVSGKTFGMAVLGVQVVSREGAPAGPRRAIVRTLVFPLSFLLLGLGFVGILIDGERRALHDIVAGTAVVYMWDARAQRLRFLARDDLAQVPAQPGPPAHERAPADSDRPESPVSQDPAGPVR